jgi:hypothetical protein
MKFSRDELEILVLQEQNIYFNLIFKSLWCVRLHVNSRYLMYLKNHFRNAHFYVSSICIEYIMLLLMLLI